MDDGLVSYICYYMYLFPLMNLDAKKKSTHKRLV